MGRIFLLSPARLDGRRADYLFHPRTPFALAAGLRTQEGVPIGQVYRFLSGLYFRGKLAYAEAFAEPPAKSWVGSGVLVITPNRGLVPAETRVTVDHLEAFAETNIHQKEARFTKPLVRDARLLDAELAADAELVLLGSVASGKYVEPLLEVFGERLRFPSDFVGRGDMSRGGLLLRSVAAKTMLPTTPVLGAVRHGVRPPKLPRKDQRRGN